MNMLVANVGMIAGGDENGSGNRKGPSPRSGLLNARRFLTQRSVVCSTHQRDGSYVMRVPLPLPLSYLLTSE